MPLTRKQVYLPGKANHYLLVSNICLAAERTVPCNVKPVTKTKFKTPADSFNIQKPIECSSIGFCIMLKKLIFVFNQILKNDHRNTRAELSVQQIPQTIR